MKKFVAVTLGVITALALFTLYMKTEKIGIFNNSSNEIKASKINPSKIKASKINPSNKVPVPCPMNIDPVCGLDNKSYANECNANANGTHIKHKGNCR
ncbi:MAG: hypothetical protein JJV96_02280 [Alphaproteobacteria bacterium]|nr:hypothetical protein [Alphaproteobacteria bacterium]